MFKKLLLSLMLILTFFNTDVKAFEKPIPPVSQIYTEGIYRFSNSNTISVDITLLTDTKAKIILLDKNFNIIYMSTLPYKEKFTFKVLPPGLTICLIGEAEVALTFDKQQ